MAAFRVLLTDRAWPDVRVEQEILQPVNAALIEAPSQGEATLIELARDADAIATNWAAVTDAVVRAATRCRIIARLGIGLDNIAVGTATQLGIPVTNVPAYCVPEVSDHALALLLACARQIGFFHLRTKRGEYDLQAAPAMHRLAGQTLGLIGLGKIAQTLVPKARVFGLTVIAHTASGQDHGTGCEMVSLEELLARSDFVSLHVPLTDATYHLLGAEQFARMKPTAYLINTSRGGLIDHAALWQALRQHRLAGAALDVFDPEPPDLSQPLFQDERVIVTPHAAFASEQSVVEVRTTAMEQIVTALRGERPRNVVNPPVYEPG